jgi:hypothetical protein
MTKSFTVTPKGVVAVLATSYIMYVQYVEEHAGMAFSTEKEKGYKSWQRRLGRPSSHFKQTATTASSGTRKDW